MKHLVGDQLEDQVNIPPLADLEKLMFRVLALRRSEKVSEAHSYV